VLTTARYLCIIIALAIGLGLGSQAAETKECPRETPLPADVCLIAPSPETCKWSLARWMQPLCVSHRDLLLRVA
jgi:hypothetical protein